MYVDGWLGQCVCLKLWILVLYLACLSQSNIAGPSASFTQESCTIDWKGNRKLLLLGFPGNGVRDEAE